MSDFSLSEILLLSNTERRGRRIQFGPEITLVEGKNDTGKSALLKSIYWTFGAESAHIHPRWRDADISSLVRFTVDRTEYQILRRRNFIALFSRGGQHLGSYTSVTKELAPRLSTLFDFGLHLTNRQGEAQIPPPAFLFLPFYVDQDRGWSSSWNSFENLAQFSRWKVPTVEYHTGIRNNEYYEITVQLDAVKAELLGVTAQLQLLQKVLRELRQEAGGVEFDTDLESFQQQVEDLLDECVRLRDIENDLRAKLNELYNQRTTLNTQVAVVERAINELKKDYKFATFELEESEVSCPTCGTQFDNSFSERFAIAEDEDRLSEFLVDLRDKLAQINEEVNVTTEEFNNQRQEVRRVQQLMEARQGEVTLEVLLRAQGRREVYQSFSSRIEAGYEQVRLKDAERQRLEGALRENKKASQERRKQILSRYERLMRRFTQELNVHTLGEAAYQKPTASIRETGSDLPRALMAYYYSVLHVMREFSPSVYCPIVIDSPNQQDQDQENVRTILQFVRDNRPSGAQLILGVADTYGIKFSGVRVELTEKYRLLRTEEYAPVASAITPLLQAALSHDLM